MLVECLVLFEIRRIGGVDRGEEFIGFYFWFYYLKRLGYI